LEVDKDLASRQIKRNLQGLAKLYTVTDLEGFEY